MMADDVVVDRVGERVAILPQQRARLREHAAAGQDDDDASLVVVVVVVAGDDFEATSTNQQAKLVLLHALAEC